LQTIIVENRLTSFFQPIVSLEHGTIYAYEALCRTVGPNPFDTIENLFQQALVSGQTLQLDMCCRNNSFICAAKENIPASNGLLFVNICPTSLLHPDHNTGLTEKMAHNAGIKKENIVLEITEQEAVVNYNLFKKAIDHYRKRGFRIAIDDFGAGYGGLKMLSMLEPDYVKIDRHFFQHHGKGNINYNLIDAIATACHRIGIDVIAEGIECENDLQICREIGIQLLQGYHFAKPSREAVSVEQLDIPILPSIKSSGTKLFDEVICIGDISNFVEPIDINDRVLEVLKRLTASPQLDCIPVLNKDRLSGLINRRRFMESHMVGRHGYGMSLNYYKNVGDVLEESFLQVPHYSSVEEVARKVHLRQQLSVYDDICVTRSGKYIGTVSVRAILNAVTENSMMIARGANPLTGLPGNEFIQRQIAQLLSRSVHFDVCYIDIDSFKPYNDRHGFEMGDRVIKKVGDILVSSVKKWDQSNMGFAGHIGGDDFIIITRPKHALVICEYVLEQFNRLRKDFHTQEELADDMYMSVDREGNRRQFGLLSLSIGVVSTEIHRISSIAEISSIASDLKKRAKAISGSVIIRDRREQTVSA
jgi:diguanylate cyclase (GGDEF)-like protein